MGRVTANLSGGTSNRSNVVRLSKVIDQEDGTKRFIHEQTEYG
ncbi:hypothetical protein ACS127_01100 [Amphibacillus sp. Q70]